MRTLTDTSFDFGAFRLDAHSYELFENGAPVPLPIQSAKILAILVVRAGQLVTREEIRSAVWSDRYIDFDAGLNSEIKKIRHALGDSASAPTFIETVPRRGYRFIAPVSAVDGAARTGIGRQLASVAVVLLLALAAWFAINNPAPVGDGAHPDAVQPAAFQSPAYDAQLKARVALSERQFDRAAQLFEQALAVDPNFAPAYAGLARVHISQRYQGWQRIEQAMALAEKSQALDPSFLEARTLQAGMLLYYYRAPERSAAVLKNARASGEASADLFVTDAYRRMIVGDTEGAIKSAEKAYATNPVSPTLNANYGWVFYKARRFADAERLCKTSVDLSPQSVFALECVIHVNHSQRDYAEAAEYGMRLMAVRGASKSEVAAVRSVESAQEREQAYWRWTLAWLERNVGNSLDVHSSIGIAHTLLGQTDQAVTAFDRAFERGGEAFLAFLAVDPRTDGLRSHPDFSRLALRARSPVRP